MKNLLKATIWVCLFLCPLISVSQKLDVSDANLRAYRALWRLDSPVPIEDLDKLDAIGIYIQSLHQSAHIILADDESLLSDYERSVEQLEDRLDTYTESGETLFVRAEIQLHNAFVQLHFENNLSASWALRKAYKRAQNTQKKYPTYKPILKTSGLLDLVIGSIPKKYEWLISLLGLEGSISKGVEALNQIIDQGGFFKNEGVAFLELSRAYLNVEIGSDLPEIIPTSSLSRLINTLVAYKTGKNDVALSALNEMGELNINYPLINYYKAECYLRAGEYDKSLANYHTFLELSNGKSNVKDAYFKSAIVHHLTNNVDSTKHYVLLAKTLGEERTDADKHAAKVLKRPSLQNRQILKIRYLTDGGYYTSAQNLVDSLDQVNWATKEEQLGFGYRKARLYHLQEKSNEAIQLYMNVIEKSPTKGYYYAPNSCLQLGYIFSAAGQNDKAKEYFEKVYSFSKHEYKSSLDQKAKAALMKLQ